MVLKANKSSNSIFKQANSNKNGSGNILSNSMTLIKKMEQKSSLMLQGAQHAFL